RRRHAGAESAEGTGRREADASHRGDHQLDDRQGTPPPPDHQRSTAEADCQRFGDVGGRGEPLVEAVHPDEEDAQGHGWHGGARERKAGETLGAGRGDEGMLVIRLRRAGSKKRPFFRVVVTDSRAARDSSFVEVLGHYNPRTKPESLTLNRERLAHWLKEGAQASDTVRTLVQRMPPEAPAAETAA